ncbi:MAG: hypothetical protein DHS20C18_12470 [Saprospiraceae bacterium]|nr:MAG: hypothetical protein DHS20C18_12470 [Saprospiraceae bacterium]
MRSFLYIFFVLLVTDLAAQNHPSCDGLRYRSAVFSEIESSLAIKYGAGTTYNGEQQELFLDVYYPADDAAESRPAIVLAFGGSFIFGAREDLKWMCEAYARMGYVAVTIDYRLYDGPLLPLPSAAAMKDVVVKTISDMKAAIRYLREDADTDNLFKIDPDYIFAGGISAGSITACHTAALDETDNIPQDLLDIVAANGGFEGNSSDNHQYSSEIRGLVNYSGGLHDAHWLDENDPPFVSFHDDGDDVVPYGGDFATIFGFPIIYIDGSQVLNHVGDSLGINNTLYTIENSNGHVSYFGDSTEVVLQRSANFLYEIICGEVVNDIDVINESGSLVLYPNPTNGLIQFEFEEKANYQVTLLDVFGSKLGSWNDPTQLDLSTFHGGIYFIEFEDKTSKTKLIRRVVLEK